MKFDPTKDKRFDCRVVDADREGQQLEVKRVSYDGGPEKIQISRCETADVPKFLKLGRLTLAEAERVRDAITEVLPKGA